MKILDILFSSVVLILCSSIIFIITQDKITETPDEENKKTWQVYTFLGEKPVSIIQLIADPKRYEGELIAVKGYLRYDKLYFDQEHAQRSLFNYAIMPLPTLGPSKQGEYFYLGNECNEGWVEIAGTWERVKTRSDMDLEKDDVENSPGFFGITNIQRIFHMGESTYCWKAEDE